MPVISGNVIVLSAVGFVTVSVVSKAFAVAPSNTIDFKLVIAKSPSPSVELYVTSLKSVKFVTPPLPATHDNVPSLADCNTFELPTGNSLITSALLAIAVPAVTPAT